MIVKDEAEHLPGCLACIEPVVDEMVIVDTGSSDDTVAIGRQYGANIHHFPWISDFAAARNESIRHANGRYILWLDADDRIEPEDIEKIAILKNGFPSDATEAYALQIICRNSLGEDVVYYQLRIFPHIEGIGFEGAVHEELTPSLHDRGIRIIKKDIAIIHTGYSDLDVLNKKMKRNFRILLKKEAEYGLSTEDHARLAQNYFGMREYDLCIERLLMARTRGGPSARFYKKSYVTLADCYLQLGQGEAAVALLKQALLEYPDSWYMHYLMGATHVLIGNSAQALPHLETAIRAPRMIEDFPVLSNIEARILYYLGRCYEDSALLDDAKNTYEKSLAIAPHDFDTLRAYGFAAARLGMIDQAMEAFRKAKARAPRLDRGTWLALADIYGFLGDMTAATNLYQEILEENSSDIDALRGMDKITMKVKLHENS